MRQAASGDRAGVTLAAWLGGREGHEDRDWSALRSRAVMIDLRMGDFQHKGAATIDGLVSMGQGVGFCLDIIGSQEESSRQWRPGLCRWPGRVDA